jgi:tripartite ATP-independent transporter DctP family solute receptor
MAPRLTPPLTVFLGDNGGMAMRKRMIGLLSTALIPGLMLLGSVSYAAEINEHTIKFATAGAIGSPIALGMEKFAELVQEKSGGQITVKRFPGGTLGGDIQTLSALQGGTVEMTSMNAGILASVAKDFAMVDLPFLFESPKEADAVMDGPVGDALAAELPEKGLVGLGYWELGFRQLSNNRHPITKVDDIAGLKIRVIQSPIYIDLFNTLGANAVPMAFTELYTALETGAIDGQENPAPSILTAKLNEVQKYLTLTQHTYNPQIVMISGKFWDKLNDDERKLIQEATLEARDYQRMVSREQAGKAVDELKAEGMEVSELPPEEVAKFREKAKPVADKYAAQIDPALVQQLHDEIAKVRGKS